LLWKYPFGVGPGGFQNVWERFGPYPNVYLGTPHQLFLSVGVDYGLMALLVFGAVLAYAFYSLNKIHKTHAADVSLARILKISVIGYVVYGMITDGELSHLSGFTFPNNGYTLILFSVLAMASNFINKYKKNV
jgi:O-antigen ligase